MKNRKLIPLFLALATSGALSAKEPVAVIVPAAKAILEESIKAAGGREAMAKIKSRQIEGEMEMPAQGMKMKLSIKQKAPMKAIMKVEVPDMMTSEQGYDGKVAWAKDTVQGLRKLAGPELAQAKEGASIFPELEIIDNLISAQLLEDVVEAGKTLKVVKVTSKGASAKTLYFDKETKLLTKMTTSVATGPGGKMEVTTFVSNYKELDGVKYPTVMKMKMMGQDMIMTYSSVKHNVEIDDSIFSIPE